MDDDGIFVVDDDEKLKESPVEMTMRLNAFMLVNIELNMLLWVVVRPNRCKLIIVPRELVLVGVQEETNDIFLTILLHF